MRCLFCQEDIERFQDHGVPPRSGLCPRCGSLPGERELAWFFSEFVCLAPGQKVLEIGPTPAQARHFPAFLEGARYTAIGLEEMPPLAAPRRYLVMDATRMAFSDQCFDVIVCNHVLPYIKSDYQAMSQMHRCLKGAGFAVINVPIVLEKTRRAPEMRGERPELYTAEYLAANGTEWMYGEDFFERLEAAGFFHTRLKLWPLVRPEVAAPQGFREDAELLLCFKFRETMENFLGGLERKRESRE